MDHKDAIQSRVQMTVNRKQSCTECRGFEIQFNTYVFNL